jgi:hypothetical protein
MIVDCQLPIADLTVVYVAHLRRTWVTGADLRHFGLWSNRQSAIANRQ